MRAARMLGQIALICGLPLALVAGAVQPLINVVLGAEWIPTSEIVLWGSLALILGASVASPINSYFLAEGSPNTPVLAIAVELVVGYALIAILLGGLDETAIGIAMSAGAAVSAAILLLRSEPRVRAGIAKVARVTAISFLAAAAGQLLPVSYDLAGLLSALCVSAIAWLVLAAIFLRSDLGRVAGMIRGVAPGAAR